MALRLITAGASPVTLAEARAHVNATHTSDDALIQLYLDAATSHFDGIDGTLGRAISMQTWELVIDEFPSGPIALPLPPLQSVASVSYLNIDGVMTNVDPSMYSVDYASDPGWISPSDSWPATYSTLNAVVVRFVAGYTQVPAALKAAILLLMGDLYANRESSIVGASYAVNPAVHALSWPYRANLGV